MSASEILGPDKGVGEVAYKGGRMGRIGQESIVIVVKTHKTDALWNLNAKPGMCKMKFQLAF